MPLLQARGQDERTESLLREKTKRRVYFREESCGIRTGTWRVTLQGSVYPPSDPSKSRSPPWTHILCTIRSWLSANFQHFELWSSIRKRSFSPASSNSHRERNIWSLARPQWMQHTASPSSTALTGPGKKI